MLRTGKTNMKVHKIAVIGTRPQGRGLARRPARAGRSVVIGSRSADRAAVTGGEVRDRTGGDVSGTAEQNRVLT
jgi:8-hydroxy-5-deazaflavin:NADPH oxidoreductase